MLEWLEGLPQDRVVKKEAQGVFQGQTYRGADLTPQEMKDHFTSEHSTSVHEKIGRLVTID